MPEFELEESTVVRRNGSVPVLPAPTLSNVSSDERGLLQAYLSELDVYYEAVKEFHGQEPDIVMQQIAAFSGRLCEIRAKLQRIGSTRANQLRTREVDPLMDQMNFQYTIASRLQSVREHEFKMSGGGV